MLARIAAALSRFSSRWVPDAWVIAVLLTVGTAGLALAMTDAGPSDVVRHWGDGFWKFLTFAMQMCLVIMTGYMLSTAPPVRRVLEAAASLATTPRAAVVLMAVLSLALIGVVTGVQGMRWYDLAFEGEACHAGTTPMGRRRDPAQSLWAVLSAFFEALPTFGEDARATVGVLRSEPESRNTVPARVRVSVDLRHPIPESLDAMENALRAQVAECAARNDTPGDVACIWDSPPVSFDAACVDAVRGAASALGLRHRDIVSGAGHDSVYVSRVAPTAMIFVPCLGGLSHNEAESATPDDLGAGCDVLLHAVLERDRASL